MVVDSILAPEEAIRRFRVGLTHAASFDGPDSRDELVRRFIKAVEAKDARALRNLAISRSEFAYLVYPESRLSRPPYRQPPEIAWMLLESGTNAGINKLLSRSGGGFHMLGYVCPAEIETEGALRITSGCAVKVHENGTQRDVRLFGRIVERDGRFKFAGLAGDL